MNKNVLVAFLASLGIAAASAAYAQSIELGPGGVRVNPPGFDRGYERSDRDESLVSRRDAARIARRAGMIDIQDFTRTRGRWIVEGEDQRGNDMRIVIDARTGDILSVSR